MKIGARIRKLLCLGGGAAKAAAMLTALVCLLSVCGCAVRETPGPWGTTPDTALTSGPDGSGFAGEEPTPDGSGANNRWDRTGLPDYAYAPGYWQGRRIAVLGDSITELNGFQQYLETRLGATVYSHGLSGSTITGSAATGFCARALELEKDAELVLVFGGTNDFYFNHPLGTPDGRESLNDFCGALKKLISRVTRRCPDALVVFVTPLQRVYPAQDSTGALNKLGLSTEDYANAMLAVCGANGIPVADMYHLGRITVDNAAQYLYDGLHPNADGFRVLGEDLAGYLGG